jgi:hypothetical protein
MPNKQDSDSNISSRESILQNLAESEINFSFNRNPEQYISRSLTQTKLKKYFDCPACFFTRNKKDNENNPEIMKSNTIHFLAEYLFRNQERFPNSRSVLDFINFSEGNFLEFLKTDSQNTNYDILAYLANLEDSKEKAAILRSVLIAFGTSKRLGFEGVRKNDAISLNLKNSKNKINLTFYSKPDLTGRHKTLYPKSGRTYDQFLIDYKLNFSSKTKSNAIQMAFYFLTHNLSRRNTNNYLVLDITSGNLFRLQNIDLKHLYSVINKFLILKNLNFRGKNKNHNCESIEDIFQESFLDNLDIENFGESFGSRTYNELLFEIRKLEDSLEFVDLGTIVKPEELDKILASYPIKN